MNKLALIKRSIYGRGKLDLLRPRVLHAAVDWMLTPLPDVSLTSIHQILDRIIKLGQLQYQEQFRALQSGQGLSQCRVQANPNNSAYTRCASRFRSNARAESLHFTAEKALSTTNGRCRYKYLEKTARIFAW